MAAPGRQAPEPLSKRLREVPQDFEFLQALLLLEREQPDATPLGQGSSPEQEAVRLRGPLTPTFAPSQVARLQDVPGQPPILSTAVFGLGGPDGPLPYAIRSGCNSERASRIMLPRTFSTCSTIACSHSSIGCSAATVWRWVFSTRNRHLHNDCYWLSAACCHAACKIAWHCRMPP